MFCPECGKPLVPAATVTEPDAAVLPSALTPPADAEPVAVQETEKPAPSLESALVAANPETAADKPVKPDESGPHGARERTRAGLHRASTVARGAIEDNVKRVEKIHHVSTAMIEEAHYDPSLRFVLVALGLFAVFIILLVLSKVMG